MLRLSGTSRTEPATLGLRHGVATQGVFAHQSRLFELLLDGRERCRRRRVSSLLGNFAGEGYDYDPEKRAALDFWGKRLEQIVTGKRGGKVLAFAAHA